MTHLECYNPDYCCRNIDCYLYEARDNEPCWGNVQVVAEEYTEDDHWWIHACEGHYDCYDGGKYKNKEGIKYE